MQIAGVTLRPYQERTIVRVRAAVRRGSKRPLIVAPTGAGKTTIASALAVGHLAKLREAARIVWVAHRRELLAQGAGRLALMGCPVEYEGAGRGNPALVTSIQSLLARGLAPEASLVFLDEAHHYVSPEWLQVVRAWMGAAAAPLIVGLTATPERDDGTGLGEVFDSLTVAASIAELVELNRSSPTEGLVESEIIDCGRKLKNGQIAQDPVVVWRRFADGVPAVVFAPNVQSAQVFCDGFTAAGVRAAVVHGELDAEIRKWHLDAFERGDLDVLCNVAILTEGWDCPRAKCVILARNVGSLSLYMQMVGRGLRPYLNQRCIVIDLCGVLATHGPYDQDLEYSLDGRAVRRLGVAADARFCRVCGMVVPPEAEACERCGRGGKELVVPHSIEAEMRRFERDQWAKTVGTDKQTGMLAQWYRAADAKGHKRASCDIKFKATFKRWPPSKVKNAAAVLADATRAEA